jgi:SAM-dependent methyltransferase
MFGSGPLRVVDLGAGSGWLSHRLAAAGHHVVAVDRLDDEADGLGACRYYETPFAAVHADFDALPFEPAQFDLAIFDGSLHYSADPAATLVEARRMLAPGGAIAVVDSPMFRRDADGVAMVDGQLRRIAAAHGVPAPLRGGVGFFTFDGLNELTARIGLNGRFMASRGPLTWRLRRQLARIQLGRAPAAFGVWMAR